MLTTDLFSFAFVPDWYGQLDELAQMALPEPWRFKKPTNVTKNQDTPILERYEVPEKDRTYIMAFYIRGLMAIITEWLKTDCKDSIEYIITVIQKCVMRHQEEK